MLGGDETFPSSLSVCRSRHLVSLLQLYRVEHGNVNVKSTDDKHKDLYKWIVQLRKDYKVRTLTKENEMQTVSFRDTCESLTVKCFLIL